MEVSMSFSCVNYVFMRGLVLFTPSYCRYYHSQCGTISNARRRMACALLGCLM
jgi:hypothetical protein